MMATDAKRAVTFVALNYAPSVGGAQDYIRHVAEGLAARGHQVEVLTRSEERRVGKECCR